MQNEAFAEGHRCTLRRRGTTCTPSKRLLKIGLTNGIYRKIGDPLPSISLTNPCTLSKEFENSYASTECVELEISVNEKNLNMTNSLFILTFQFNVYFVTFQH